jgi:PA domain
VTETVTEKTAYVKPLNSCTDIQNRDEVNGKIAIVKRGECTFVDKARRAMNAGASALSKSFKLNYYILLNYFSFCSYFR